MRKLIVACVIAIGSVSSSQACDWYLGKYLCKIFRPTGQFECKVVQPVYPTKSDRPRIETGFILQLNDGIIRQSSYSDCPNGNCPRR